ncbi:hypothetical protein KN10_1052 [Anoxybacillus flavithermus NBRC 109594]|uniref:Uncharacterized protein n=1 Tax=Anoxybacillus flavithermus NBRC 109594 TaxID=1315967 RepID=R4FAT2_9BACL|nr:hypothetical protein KN10_1052 [Anoxybacillus flavithermus NBRC 109594]
MQTVSLFKQFKKGGKDRGEKMEKAGCLFLNLFASRTAVFV